MWCPPAADRPPGGSSRGCRSWRAPPARRRAAVGTPTVACGGSSARARTTLLTRVGGLRVVTHWDHSTRSVPAARGAGCSRGWCSRGSRGCGQAREQQERLRDDLREEDARLLARDVAVAPQRGPGRWLPAPSGASGRSAVDGARSRRRGWPWRSSQRPPVGGSTRPRGWRAGVATSRRGCRAARPSAGPLGTLAPVPPGRAAASASASS